MMVLSVDEVVECREGAMTPATRSFGESEKLFCAKRLTTTFTMPYRLVRPSTMSCPMASSITLSGLLSTSFRRLYLSNSLLPPRKYTSAPFGSHLYHSQRRGGILSRRSSLINKSFSTTARVSHGHLDKPKPGEESVNMSSCRQRSILTF